LEITIIILGALLAIALSNILNIVYPKLPLPILQIAFGCLLGLAFYKETLNISPEIFMAIIIAPLLFREADETNGLSLWSARKTIFIMAFLLVFLTVFVVGFATKWLLPTVPLFACFALGAILGPTDAVAVSSLSARISLPKKLSNILEGEGLINDASGLIAFRFAVAALLTDVFSPLNAVGEFLWVSIGGLLVGIILAQLERYVVRALKRLSINNTSTYILIELIMPFLCYIVAEAIGVSGILAAVAAGIFQTSKLRSSETLEAEVGTAKNTLWGVVTFTLNSFVFLLLGLQLPQIFSSVWNNVSYSPLYLLLAIVLITAALLAVRLVCIRLFANKVLGSTFSEKLRNLFVLTLAGAKGTISLVTAFALPLIYLNGDSFAQRDLLLFIAAGVIILTLLLALFVLPLIASPAEKAHSANELAIEILNEVILRLSLQDTDHVEDAVILSYMERIENLEYTDCTHKERKELRRLQFSLYRFERDAIKAQYKQGEISFQTYRNAQELLYFIYDDVLKFVETRAAFWYLWSKIFHSRHLVEMPKAERESQFTELFWRSSQNVIAMLEDQRGLYPDKAINRLKRRRSYIADQMLAGIFSGTMFAFLDMNYESELLKGFALERQVIQEYTSEGKIQPEAANELQINLNQLESYMMSDERRVFSSQINNIVVDVAQSNKEKHPD
jgi:CPA1 family monovalent cation:H+ antiporter